MEEATIIAIVAIIVIVLIVIGIITILYWCFHKSEKESNELHDIEEGNGGQFLPQKELTNHKESVHNRVRVRGNVGAALCTIFSILLTL